MLHLNTYTDVLGESSSKGLLKSSEINFSKTDNLVFPLSYKNCLLSKATDISSFYTTHTNLNSLTNPLDLPIAYRLFILTKKWQTILLKNKNEENPLAFCSYIFGAFKLFVDVRKSRQLLHINILLSLYRISSKIVFISLDYMLE